MKHVLGAWSAPRRRDDSIEAARGLGSLSGVTWLLLCWNITAFGQVAPTAHPVRPLLLHQDRYRLRAGEPARLEAPSETLEFLRTAKASNVTISGTKTKGFAVGPSLNGDGVLVAASLTMKEGEYAVIISATDQSGEERATEATITVAALPTVPSGSSTPPVVLLNGWQIGFSPGFCPMSSNLSIGTFGHLASPTCDAPILFL